MKSCPQCGKTFDDHFRVCPHDGVQLVEAAPAPSDPMIGKLLAGRFRLTRKLGQGGMGTVYKAVHTEMDRACAIKLLLTSAEDSEAAVARFKREARMASRIESPHAVTIYDFGQAEGGLLYLAMEFIDGRPLSEALAKEWPLGVERVVRITEQITEALSSAHSLGIVHRDLKPDNIMLTSRAGEADYVKVLDFGIAKSLVESEADKVTRTGFVLGTPLYMSPEQIAGETIDARSDIYSLAIIVYEMLSGRLPFEGENTQAIMYKRVMSSPIPLRSVAPSMSEAMERAVMRGLARNSSDRPATVTDFAAELSRAASVVTQNIEGRETDRMADERSDLRTSPILGQGTVGDGPRYQMNPGAATPLQASPLPMQGAGLGQAQQPAALPYPPPPTRMAQPGVDQLATKPISSNKIGIIIAIVAVALLVLGVSGYFLYSSLRPAESPAARTAQADQSAEETPPSREAPTAPAIPPDQQASEYFEQGKKHQEQARLLADTGAKSEALEENRKAIDQYRQAIAVKPRFPEARENLGVALYDTGQLEAAVDQYRVAIDQYIELYSKPTDKVYTNYALALFDLKRYPEAADAFGRAFEIDPRDYDLLAYRGFALQNAGNEVEARAAYNRYLKEAPAGQYAGVVREILAGRALPPVDTGNN